MENQQQIIAREDGYISLPRISSAVYARKNIFYMTNSTLYQYYFWNPDNTGGECGQ